jgi:hypothetical protein
MEDEKANYSKYKLIGIIDYDENKIKKGKFSGDLPKKVFILSSKSYPSMDIEMPDNLKEEVKKRCFKWINNSKDGINKFESATHISVVDFANGQFRAFERTSFSFDNYSPFGYDLDIAMSFFKNAGIDTNSLFMTISEKLINYCDNNIFTEGSVSAPDRFPDDISFNFFMNRTSDCPFFGDLTRILRFSQIVMTGNQYHEFLEKCGKLICRYILFGRFPISDIPGLEYYNFYGSDGKKFYRKEFLESSNFSKFISFLKDKCFLKDDDISKFLDAFKLLISLS